jgi:hypothetical protein
MAAKVIMPCLPWGLAVGAPVICQDDRKHGELQLMLIAPVLESLTQWRVEMALVGHDRSLRKRYTSRNTSPPVLHRIAALGACDHSQLLA